MNFEVQISSFLEWSIIFQLNFTVALFLFRSMLLIRSLQTAGSSHCQRKTMTLYLFSSKQNCLIWRLRRENQIHSAVSETSRSPLENSVSALFLPPSFPQFAQFTTSDGRQLPASDWHAHCKNLLFYQWGAGPVPQLPHGDPENYLHPGDVWQPAGRHFWSPEFTQTPPL